MAKSTNEIEFHPEAIREIREASSGIASGTRVSPPSFGLW